MSAASAGLSECEIETIFPGQRYVTRAFLDIEPHIDNNSPPTATSTPILHSNINESNTGFSQVEDVFENDDDLDELSRSELREQLTQKQETIRHLEQLRFQYEKDISSLTSEIENLQAANERAVKVEVDRERTLQEQERIHASVRRERDELHETLVQNESSVHELRAQIRVLEAERSKFQRELDEAEDKISELTDAVCVLQVKIIDTDKDTTGLQLEVEQLQQQIAEQVGKNEETIERVSHLQRELSDKAEEVEHSRMDKQQLQSTIEKLKRQLLTASSPPLNNASSNVPNGLNNMTYSQLNVSNVNEENAELQHVLLASFLNNNSYLHPSSVPAQEVEHAPVSLGDEIHALCDPGTLPVGLESVENLNISALGEKMLEERQSMLERQCVESHIQHLEDAREDQQESKLANKLINAVSFEKERLAQVLECFVPSQPCEEPEAESCFIVWQLANIRDAVKSATESLSERMGGLELQVTQATAAEEEPPAPAPPSATTGPSSIADGSVSLAHHIDERTCSEASWSRGGGSGVASLHPVPLRDISIEGSDAVSCAGSHMDRDTCTHVTPERIKCQVHRELAALQSQINKSLEVLAALARSSDLLSVFKEVPVSEVQQTDAISAASGTVDAAKDANLQPSGMGCTHQLAKSCPALQLQLSAATQTDDLLNHQRISSTGDVKRECGEPSPKRFRSSSFVAAIQADKLEPIVIEEDEQLIVEKVEDEEDMLDEEDVDEEGSVFETRRESLDLDDFRLGRKLSVLHEEADEGTTEPRPTARQTHHVLVAPPPYRSPPNPYQSRSFESYLDPEPDMGYPEPYKLCPQGSIKRQVSDPTPAPPPYRAPPAPGERVVAQVHREENGAQCGPRSTSRPLQLPPTSPSHPSTKAVHFDATSPQSPPYMTPTASPWTSPRASACIDEPPPVVSARASALRASLRRRSCRVTEEHPAGVSPPPTHMEEEPPTLQEQQEGDEKWSPDRPPSLHPRLRSRGSIPGSSTSIQRSVAVDFDENEEHAQTNGSTGTVAGAGGKRLSVAFPSLPEALLRKLELHRDSLVKPETLTENDVENKFTRLSLAFKTDKLTLDSRLSNQQRQRDDAERNVAREVSDLRAKLNRLQRLCQESETIEELSEVQRQVDALAQSTESVSRAAEMYGAVQQEERVAKAVDVILAHVDNLRRTQSKEHAELEEAKRLLLEAVSDDRPGDELNPVRGSRLRPQQLANVQASSRRRASIAALPRSASPAEQRFAATVDATRMRASLRTGLEATRRTSVNITQRSDTSSTDTASTDSAAISRVSSGGDSETALHGGGELVLASTCVQAYEPTPLDDDDDLSEGIADFEACTPSEDELADDLLWENGDLRHRRPQQAVLPAVTSGGHLSDWILPPRSFRSVGRGMWRRVMGVRWPWSTQQSVLMLRRGATAVLLVLAALTMLLVLVPTSIAMSRGVRVVCWNPLRIETPADFQSGFGFQVRRHHLPPT